ncbi:hypothetical protein [Streptomyces sp. NPDC002845]
MPAKPVGPVSAVGETVGGLTDAVADVAESVGHVVPPLGEHVVEPVTDEVVRPVGDLVETVTGRPAGAPPSQFPPFVGVPSLPGLPEVPELPEVPGVPTLPGLPTETLPLPVGSAPQQPEQQPGVAAGQGARDDMGRSGEREAARAYGPRLADGAGTVVQESPRDPEGVRAPHAHAQQHPGGDPTGMLDRHSAVDNGGQRHGEPHAVTVDHQASLSLVPGATAAVAVDGTRDRHRDIPEFPG